MSMPRLALFSALCLPLPIHSQSPAAPEKTAFYYGWPSAVNQSWSVAGASQVFSSYARVVIGFGLQQPSHGDHQNTLQIIAATPNTEFFGYIPLGQLTGALSLAQIQTIIADWQAMGIDGIFLDTAGFDYGVTRSLQNAVLDAVHAAGLPAWVNAWDPADVFDSSAVPINGVGGGNPSGLPTHMAAGDRYLLESFQIESGAYQNPAFFAAKGDLARHYANQHGVHLEAVTTTNGPFSQAQMDYAWWSAALYGMAGMAWGEPNFSASSAALPLRQRPAAPDMGAAWHTDPIHALPFGLHQRVADNGHLVLDAQTHTGAFHDATMQAPATVQIGTSVAIPIQAGSSPGLPYIAAAALGTSPGIALPDGRSMPLNQDFLFGLSLTANPFFVGFAGTLDSSGQGALGVVAPSQPVFAGLTFHVAFVVVDFGHAIGLRAFSRPATITLL